MSVGTGTGAKGPVPALGSAVRGPATAVIRACEVLTERKIAPYSFTVS
ncbi:hypothetical protein SAMN02745898_10883 [Streptomyces sp. 136MFCol5.1]|jgi:hypothetical protein|nr:hypothetical protein SAMN02745898_10883 [Streptomyces sp. 136MFCol5.1]SFT18404.1 hypothetical protein SAMN04487982_10986 [Streptomyces sp. ok210]